eukprot:XP_020400363.1 vegetative cell wall protein gp1-like [Zea mays]
MAPKRKNQNSAAAVIPPIDLNSQLPFADMLSEPTDGDMMDVCFDTPDLGLELSRAASRASSTLEGNLRSQETAPIDIPSSSHHLASRDLGFPSFFSNLQKQISDLKMSNADMARRCSELEGKGKFGLCSQPPAPPLLVTAPSPPPPTNSGIAAPAGCVLAAASVFSLLPSLLCLPAEPCAPAATPPADPAHSARPRVTPPRHPRAPAPCAVAAPAPFHALPEPKRARKSTSSRHLAKAGPEYLGPAAPRRTRVPNDHAPRSSCSGASRAALAHADRPKPRRARSSPRATTVPCPCAFDTDIAPRTKLDTRRTRCALPARVRRPRAVQDHPPGGPAPLLFRVEQRPYYPVPRTPDAEHPAAPAVPRPAVQSAPPCAG